MIEPDRIDLSAAISEGAPPVPEPLVLHQEPDPPDVHIESALGGRLRLLRLLRPQWLEEMTTAAGPDFRSS